MTVCIVYLFLFIYKSAIYIYRHTIIKYKSTIYNLLKKGVTCEFFLKLITLNDRQLQKLIKLVKQNPPSNQKVVLLIAPNCQINLWFFT